MKHSISKINVILILTIAIIVVAGFVSCSNREVTGDGNYSQTGGGGIVETPTTPSQPKPDDIPIYNPTKPVLEIKSDWGAIQFKGLTFKNENHTISIVIADNGCARFKLNDKIYDFGSRIYNSQYNPNTFIFGNINGNINDRGYAEFRETGDLLIWFNNNQSDLITLKLSEESDPTPDVPTTDTPTQPGTPSIPSTPSTPSTDNGEIVPNKNLPGGTYRKVYAPFTGANGYYNVSYTDTDTLDKLWKAMIDKKAVAGGARLYIKTHDGDLLFDENYNIRWSKQPSKVLKWFQGGVMVRIMAGAVKKYEQDHHWQHVYPNAHNEQDSRLGEMQGQIAVAGLYTYADSLNGASRLNSDMINLFFGYYMGREWSTAYGGRMEIIVFNDGLPVDLYTGKYNTGPAREARGLQSYMDVHDHGYTDGNHHIWNIKGSAPERYQPFLHASQLYTWGFRWAAKAYKGEDVR